MLFSETDNGLKIGHDDHLLIWQTGIKAFFFMIVQLAVLGSILFSFLFE